MTTTAGELAETLLSFVEGQLAALETGPLPGFALPRVLMGEPVGQDVRADLVFTLGLLHAAGRSSVAGRPIADAVADLLRGVDGRAVHTFYSYRIAETVARFGGFEPTNPVLRPLRESERAEVAAATDSTDWVELLDGGALPRNYAAVLARCEHARLELGLTDDPTLLDELVGRVQGLLGGHLDDSNTGVGRYDIYTVDIHLFCEPLAELVGEPWRTGTLAALDLVDRVAARNGAALAWGRSTGALACCHTIELAGLVALRDLVADPERWVDRAERAAAHLEGWFAEGWITAHQHRSSDPYRGLDRRLQMTLDCLGKLVDAALGLQQRPDLRAPDDLDLFPARDEVVWFDEPRHRGVWSYRDDRLAFALPLVGGTTTEYLPAPRNPGLFEVPVASPLATGSPLLIQGGKQFVGGGAPVAIEHDPGRLSARYEGFPRAGHLEPGPASPQLGGTREVGWTVDGRSLVVDEHLELDEIPEAVAVQVTEARHRPLRFTVECATPHTVATVPVDGIAEYRSSWGELPRLHQVDVEPAQSLRFRWTVTPLLRVASSAFGHPYSDRLYAPLADRVRVERVPPSVAWRAAVRDAFARRVDQLHLHWPEWDVPFGTNPVGHQGFIDGLRREGVRIVWTMHNLVPHSKEEDYTEVYATWARAADLVLHHSDWARQRAIDTYAFGEPTRHAVIPHAHWGPARAVDDRTAVAADLGLRHGALRIGIVGAPRAEKDVELAMRAVAACARADLELVVLSLRGDEVVPDDPRIVVHPYEMVPRDEYDRRLSALDAVLMPFAPDGDMLATGTVGDAVTAGLPTLASAWPYLAEALGDAAIVYGSTEADLTACLEALTPDALEGAAAAAVALRSSLDWTVIAERTYAELDRLGSSHH